MLDKKLKNKKPINNAKDAAKILSKMVLDEYREHFLVLTLNSRNFPISAHIISIGTIDATIVHPREVFTKAVKNRVSSIVIAHNHPSGDLEPGDSDFEITKRLRHAGSILGIKVEDSLVIDRVGNFKSII